MTGSRRRPAIAWALVAVTVACCVGQGVLLALSGVPLLSAEAMDQAFPIIPVALISGATVGALIVRRHRAHRIGWLFCIGQAGAGVGLTAQALAVGAMAHGFPLPLAIAHLAAWVSRVFGASYALTLLGLLLMLVPEGTLPSRRWRPVFGLSVGGYALVVGGLLLIPPSALDPNGGTEISAVADLLELVGQLAVTAGLLGGAVSLVVRLRRSAGEERQQLRWIGVAALALALTLTLYVGDNLLHSGSGSLGRLFTALFYLGYLAVPLATGVAVLRYRLYDVDLLIGRAVKLAVLGTFVTAGYVTAVVVTGAVLGGATATGWISVASYVVTALAFQPLRRHIDRLADRVVYGRRAAPYDSLATFGRQLAAAVSERELLLLVARSSAAAFGARSASATVVAPECEPVTERWPPDAPGRRNRDTEISVAVRFDGAAVGRIGLVLQAGHVLSRTDRRLLDDFASRAAPAFHNAALSSALQGRARELARQDAELTAARRRLVTAAVAERERVAVALSTTVAAELRQLPAALDRVRQRLPGDPSAAAAELRHLQDITSRAIDNLRRITSGVLPPLLARHGLAAAVQTFAAQSERHPEVRVDLDDPTARFGTSTEIAAYAVCVWAVTALEPGAQVRLSLCGGLRVQVTGFRPGDRPGAARRPGDSGWQHVVDRVEAVGGAVRLDRPVDRPGTPPAPPGRHGSLLSVEAVLPAAAHAASSDSGPNADLSR